MAMLKPLITVSCKNGASKTVDPRTIGRRAERILLASKREKTELSVLLCDDSFIQKLNLQYRGFDKSTDVLSFSMNEGELLGVGRELLGDVVISVETAARRAQRFNHSVTREVSILLIHGILHLLGYDHQNKADEKQMFALAEELRIKVKI